LITKLKFEGLEDLMKEFSKLGENAYEALRPSATEAGELVLERARGNIRDRTGTLSRSLKIIKPGKKKAKSGVIYARVTFGKDAAYGVPLELGHRLVYFRKKTYKRVEERPFLRPAADESKEDVAKIMAAGMNKILDEWGE
jgi:HK97 gp10 family phage protein